MRLFFRKIFVPVLTLFLLTGCALTGEEKNDLFSYLDSPASFTVLFPPLDETAVPVTCEGHISPDEITLTVAEPKRSAGMTIRYSDGRCALESGDGIPVPLSEKAAEPLTAFLRILTHAAPGEPPKKSPDGTETLVACPEGVLYLNENNLPAAVEACPADSDTQKRTIQIISWTQEKPAANP